MDYYNKNTTVFFNSTVVADLTDLYERFLKMLPSGGNILDFGCGSGRDAKAFLDRGFKVDAIDGSLEMCKMASEYAGISVRQMDFFELNAAGAYDGIWACASLLHVERERLPELMEKLRNALVQGGILYMSFKYGDFAGIRSERYFSDMNEELAQRLLEVVRGWDTVDIWQSNDVREDKNGNWLNLLLKAE